MYGESIYRYAISITRAAADVIRSLSSDPPAVVCRGSARNYCVQRVSSVCTRETCDYRRERIIVYERSHRRKVAGEEIRSGLMIRDCFDVFLFGGVDLSVVISCV